MGTKPELSVITVNYNRYGDTVALIDSLRKHLADISFETIVVDNASRTDEAEAIRRHFPDEERLVLIRSERNLGFAGGNNLGIGAARGDYLLLLNNDAFVEDGSLRELICRVRKTISGSDASPRRSVLPILCVDIQFAGYTPLSRITLRNSLIGFGEPDRGQYQAPHVTPYCHGAAMMFRRETVERVGPMPEAYFLYYEELDWCVRIAQAGYLLWYEPKATVFHRESRSAGQNSPLRTYYLTRNRLLFARRNLKGAYRWLSILYQTAVAVPKACLAATLKGDRRNASAVLRGCRDFWKIL